MNKFVKAVSITSLLVFGSHASAAYNPADKTKIQQLVTDYEQLFSDSQEAKQGMSKFYDLNGSLDAYAMYTRFPAMDSLVDMYKVVKTLEDLPSGGFTINSPSTHYLYRAINMAEIYFNSHYNKSDNTNSFDVFKEWNAGPGCKKENEVQGKNCHHYELRAAAGIAKLLLIARELDLSTDEARAVNQPIWNASRSLAKQLYRHVWRKWTRDISPGQNYLWTGETSNVNKRATDGLTRGGIVALALYSWSDEYGLPKSEFSSFIEQRAKPAAGSQTCTSTQKYPFKPCTSAETYYNIYSKLDKSPSPSNHPLGISDISHAVDNVSFALIGNHDSVRYQVRGISLTYFLNTVKSRIWNNSISNPEFLDYQLMSDTQWMSYSDKSTYEKYGDKGSSQGGWAKLSRSDSNLRLAYYNYLDAGGVSCQTGDNRKFSDATAYGKISDGKCSRDAVFSQAHLISSLLDAYLNRQD